MTFWTSPASGSADDIEEEQSAALREAAGNLLAKALDRLQMGQETAARKFIGRAAALPYDAHRIIVAGPTTLTALLGSMSMGFKTLAIQKRSSEAWQILAQVKSEFEKSGAVWDKVVKQQLGTASKTASSAGSRHRPSAARYGRWRRLRWSSR